MSRNPKHNQSHPRPKIQPPVLAMIHVVLAFLLTWRMPLPMLVPSVLQLVGFLLVILGFLLGVAALIVFRAARSGLTPTNSNTRLVTGGVYRFTRNPIYLGFLLILIGLSLNTGSYWGVFLAPLFIALFNRLVILPEEAYLLNKFGDHFTSYRDRVRRWI